MGVSIRPTSLDLCSSVGVEQLIDLIVKRQAIS